MERMSMMIRFSFSSVIPGVLSTLFRILQTALSESHIKTAPLKNPAVATAYAGVSSVCSARSIAGWSKDQKLAAIMTPAEKPSIRFSRDGLVFLKKTTVAAPRAVTDHVPSVAISAIKIILSMFFLVPAK